ncbi:MAG: hypothetical protein RLZZ571_1175 [Actinomycetota bacterium]|jgi:thiamine biosynthesis lipoprotein
MSNRAVHVEHIWGTVVSIDLRLHRATSTRTDRAIEEVVHWLHDVDEVFSTYKDQSAVSRFRRGELAPDDLDIGMHDVIKRCQRIKELTGGAFDPWAVEGGFDPSGLVKGWATDRAANILIGYGFNDFLINSGGDITVRGEPEPETLWSIGLQHPNLPGQIYSHVKVTDCAIATSGSYERGAHIINPAGGPVQTASATVIGPDCATADGLATALLVAGQPGFDWFERLPGWSAQIVENETVTSLGEVFTSSV